MDTEKHIHGYKRYALKAGAWGALAGCLYSFVGAVGASEPTTNADAIEAGAAAPITCVLNGMHHINVGMDRAFNPRHSRKRSWELATPEVLGESVAVVVSAPFLIGSGIGGGIGGGIGNAFNDDPPRPSGGPYAGQKPRAGRSPN